jgi:hypothetical protein
MAKKQKPWEAKIPMAAGMGKDKSPEDYKVSYETVKVLGRRMFKFPDDTPVIEEVVMSDTSQQKEFQITPGLIFPLKDKSWAVCTSLRADKDGGGAYCHSMEIEGHPTRIREAYKTGEQWRWRSNGIFDIPDGSSGHKFMDLDFDYAYKTPVPGDVFEEAQKHITRGATLHTLFLQNVPNAPKKHEPVKIEKGMILPMVGGKHWCVATSAVRAVSLTGNVDCNHSAGRSVGDYFMFTPRNGLYGTKESHPTLTCHIDMDKIGISIPPDSIIELARKYEQSAHVVRSTSGPIHAAATQVFVQPKTTVWRKANKAYPWGNWVGVEIDLSESSGAI